jgi:hypothetical protein
MLRLCLLLPVAARRKGLELFAAAVRQCSICMQSDRSRVDIPCMDDATSVASLVETVISEEKI